MIVFCLVSILSGLHGPRIFRDRMSKGSFLLCIGLLFLTYVTLGTYYHLQSLASVFVSDYTYTPIVCFAAIGLIYFGGVRQHIDFFNNSLTSRANRFPVQALSHFVSWFIVASISHKFNNAIWYIGVGWIFYNIATVCLFFLAFVAFVMPKVTKSVVTIEDDTDGSEMSSQMSSHSSTSRTSSTQTDDLDTMSADVTMDAVLIV